MTASTFALLENLRNALLAPPPSLPIVQVQYFLQVQDIAPCKRASLSSGIFDGHHSKNQASVSTAKETARKPYAAIFAASRIPFSDQANAIIAIGADSDSVLVEFWRTGTHLGPLRTPKGPIAPTGKGRFASA